MSDDAMQIELLRQVQLGAQTERFLASDLGGELITRMQEHHDAALTSLMHADPCDYQQIQKLQNEARFPLLFLQYLDEVVSSSQQAEEHLQLMEKE